MELVILYQLVIALTIIASGLFKAKGPTVLAVLWGVFTVTHVFMPWLMVTQFATIAASWVLGSILGMLAHLFRGAVGNNDTVQ